MTNKIVILDNSIELYEHYVDDTRWERTLAFPRGGVTYLVSNSTIKFYAFEDYLYRNCLISMQLPIYVVDEKRNIDGEYENIDELASVLDPIFPSNDIDAELDEYLRIKDAELLYQPKGDYILRSEVPDLNSFVTDDELVEALEDYYTKAETSGKTQIQDALAGKADKSDTYTKTEVDDIANGKADANDVYTKAESDSKFQLKGNYVSANTFISYTATTNAALANKAERSEIPDMTQYYTKAETSGSSEIQDALDLKANKSNTYTKAEVDEKIGEGGQFDPNRYYTKVETSDRFQPIGNYVSASAYTSFTSTTDASIQTLRGTKLDISAYTPSDLSNYYTKSEVYTKSETYNKNEIDDKIAQSGTFDPTRYYTKSDSDSRFALKNEMPSLDGYATEDWVISKNYSTKAELVTYVNNLQQQINSLMATVSGCCQTQEDVYRWITVIGEYLCENNNKYEKQKYQVSHDSGINWEDVTPIQYQKGQLIESNSKDCGYAPQPQYRWKAAPTSDYMCSGTSKYYKLYYEVSNDGGQTWQHAVPEQTKIGDLIESNSTDCGYVTPQYRWQKAASTDYICSGTTKHFKEYYQVSNDGGKTWSNVSPEQTRTSIDIIESNSADCGYVPPAPKFVLTLNDDSTVSAACDSRPSPLSKPGEISQYDTAAYQLTAVRAEIKDCVTKIDKEAFFHFENLTGVTLPNSLIEIGREAFYACYGLMHVVIPNNVTSIGTLAFYTCRGLRDITFGNSVTTIEASAFNLCEALTTITLPSSVTSLGDGAFNQCHDLRTVTCKATTPPTMGLAVFGDDKWLTAIYVPSSSVNVYKAADGWKDYASIIKPINS